MSNVVPLGITHDPGCKCRRCLNEAFRSARTEVTEATARYMAIRASAARPDDISRARQRWTEARQLLVLAEHDLRTAEDEARIKDRQDRQTDALRWNPKEVR
jgi:hypothetical protein